MLLCDTSVEPVVDQYLRSVDEFAVNITRAEQGVNNSDDRHSTVVPPGGVNTVFLTMSHAQHRHTG